MKKGREEQKMKKTSLMEKKREDDSIRSRKEINLISSTKRLYCLVMRKKKMISPL